MDAVEGVFGQDTFLEEGLQFLRVGFSNRFLGCASLGGALWELTLLMRRRDRLVSMARWRSSDTMAAMGLLCCFWFGSLRLRNRF